MSIRQKAKETEDKGETLFEITKHIYTLSEDEERNHSKEFNLVSWKKRSPKYEIREWFVNSEGKKRAGKGIILTDDETVALLDALKKLDSETDS